VITNAIVIITTTTTTTTNNNNNNNNNNNKLKEKFASGTRKTFDRFTKKIDILGTSHIIRKVLQCEA